MEKDNKKEIEKNDNIDSSMIENAVNKFSYKFNQLIEDKKKETAKKGFTTFENMMYKQIGISKSSFQDYKKKYDEGGRIPKSLELVKIHEYFGVSYSYLLGESDLKIDKDSELIELGVKLGLDDNAINTLINLKKKSDSETIEDNFEAYFKLFLINMLIQDKKFLDSLTVYFSTTLGRNIIDNKCKGDFRYRTFATDDSTFEMIKYSIMTNWIKSIEKLVNAENVPFKIKEYAEQYTIKYAGYMQSIIKEIINNDKK